MRRLRADRPVLSAPPPPARPSLPWPQRAAALLLAHWFRPQPSALSRLLQPLACVYARVQRLHQRRQRSQAGRAPSVPAKVPVVVVGNLVVGGAGKTPVVIALVQALRAAGLNPGVVARGYGRTSRGLRAVSSASTAAEVGDEPLLVWRRTGAPVVVGESRVEAAITLCAAHPAVDLLLGDDALQHRSLRRDVEVVVFDERGVGNGLLLPAGPLREPMPASPPPAALVLYNHAQPTTRWPGHCARRVLGDAVPLASWQAGCRDGALPLARLRGRALAALAGVAVPERFFAMLRAAGLEFTAMPRPDHDRYRVAPAWPAGTSDVLITEKDAVKLTAPTTGVPRIWVVPLDLQLPDAFLDTLLARLRALPR